MDNRLQRLREALMSGNGMGMGRYYGLAASTTTLIDSSTYDAIIIQKQREIVRLVAEGNDNNSKLISQTQRELGELVNAKMNNQGKSGASSSRSIKEFRRFLLG